MTNIPQPCQNPLCPHKGESPDKPVLHHLLYRIDEPLRHEHGLDVCRNCLDDVQRWQRAHREAEGSQP